MFDRLRKIGMEKYVEMDKISTLPLITPDGISGLVVLKHDDNVYFSFLTDPKKGAEIESILKEENDSSVDFFNSLLNFIDDEIREGRIEKGGENYDSTINFKRGSEIKPILPCLVVELCLLNNAPLKVNKNLIDFGKTTDEYLKLSNLKKEDLAMRKIEKLNYKGEEPHPVPKNCKKYRFGGFHEIKEKIELPTGIITGSGTSVKFNYNSEDFFIPLPTSEMVVKKFLKHQERPSFLKKKKYEEDIGRIEMYDDISLAYEILKRNNIQISDVYSEVEFKSSRFGPLIHPLKSWVKLNKDDETEFLNIPSYWTGSISFLSDLDIYIKSEKQTDPAYG